MYRYMYVQVSAQVSAQVRVWPPYLSCPWGRAPAPPGGARGAPAAPPPSQGASRGAPPALGGHRGSGGPHNSPQVFWGPPGLTCAPLEPLGGFGDDGVGVVGGQPRHQVGLHVPVVGQPAGGTGDGVWGSCAGPMDPKEPGGDLWTPQSPGRALQSP